MERFQWRSCVKSVILTEAVGFAAGLITKNGVDSYMMYAEKSTLTPPGWVFPVVWSILYALMGIGICIVLQSGIKGTDRCTNLYIAQLTVNFFWPLLFFNANAYGFSLIWLILLLLLVILMTVCFAKKKPIAALLQVPYILWLLFAAYLNAAAWLLN